MTGRRLYDHFCDALKVMTNNFTRSHMALPDEPAAWPFLNLNEQRVWNDMARRISLKKAVRR